MSPASTESLQSGTPSSDYPLEKVSSYLLPSDDLEDSSCLRPVRAYSVGSRSDTGATGKGRYGKNRLEAVQETFRMRALSVGARNPRANKPTGNLFSPSSGIPGPVHGSSSSVSSVPLSSSWSGSTGRWPPPRGTTLSPATSGMSGHSHQNSDTIDSDLMELDFSHNRDKKGGRKRSLPGPTGAGLLTPTGPLMSSPANKISPCSKGISESPEMSPYMHMSVGVSSSAGPTTPSPYTTSAPISIQKKNSLESGSGVGGFAEPAGVSILTRMTGLDLKKLKNLDDEGAYLEMDFKNGSGSTPPRGNPLVVKPNDNVVPAHFSLNSIQEASPVSSLAPTPIPWTLGLSTPKPDTLHISTTPSTTTASTTLAISPGLSRIEESPEKQDPKKLLSHSHSQLSPNTLVSEKDGATSSTVTYATIEHLNPGPVKKSPVSSTPSSAGVPLHSNNLGGSCGKISKYPPVTSVPYSQIDFVKSAPEAMKNN